MSRRLIDADWLDRASKNAATPVCAMELLRVARANGYVVQAEGTPHTQSIVRSADGCRP
jgi:hypothetical protein